MKTITRILVAGALAVLGVILAVIVLSPSSPAPRPVPQPNGYEDWLRAIQIIPGKPVDPSQLSPAALRTRVAQDAEALRLARQGLQKPVGVPLNFTVAGADQRMADLAGLKRLAQAFQAEGKLAEAENRFPAAARAYLDTIRFGHELVRGGPMIDMLVGVACRSIGSRALQDIALELDASECRGAARELEAMAAKAVTAADVLGQERAWSRQTFGWRGRFSALVMRRSMKQNEQRAMAKLAAQELAETNLISHLDARAAELEK